MTQYDPGTRVAPRRYIVARQPELAGRTGAVEALDGKTIVVRWDGLEDTYRHAASNLKPARAAQSPGRQASPVSDRPRSPERTEPSEQQRALESDEDGTVERLAAVERALDPNASEIADDDVEELRKQPSERQRFIAHLLDPGEDHDHGLLQVAGSTARSASLRDLRAWHNSGHGHATTGDPHEV